MLQFILQENTRYTLPEMAQMAIEGGCKWVVLDVPALTDAEVRELAADLVPLCRETSTILTITDRVELAKELGLHGVVLTPASPLSARAARELCGPEAIIGVQVSVASSAMALTGIDVDYVVFPAEVPVATVGENVEALRIAKFVLPVVATVDSVPDIDLVKALGINGLAMGAPLANASDPIAATEEVVRLLQK